MAGFDTQVVVIGGGVVGCAVCHALARRGVESVLLEAEAGLGLGASGSNSGILHTGFDSKPRRLETRLILRSAELREELLEELDVNVRHCGARLEPGDGDELVAVRRLAENARGNGVEVRLEEDGSLNVPGEAVTDPVDFLHALAGAARGGGAEVRLGARVDALAPVADGGPDGGLVVGVSGDESLRARAGVNCAGLFADELARLAGDEIPEIYPRKGEFLVFSAPRGEELPQIMLPVPSALGKGVLVFPTVEGQLIAGPTARERENKTDWSVEPDARELILPRARRMYPALARATEIGAYAGLRTAGRGANYVIERSRGLPGLTHVAAIRSTGLSASLAIGEHVVAMLAEDGLVELGPTRALPAPRRRSTDEPWWQRAAGHHAAAQAPDPA